MKLKNEEPETAQQIIDEAHNKEVEDSLIYQYNGVSEAYSEATKKRLKTGLQYYSAKLLFLDGKSVEGGKEALKGREILDMGCGDGESSRIAARLGASVTGYDVSAKQIEAAKLKEESEPLGIKYYTSENPDTATDKKFDMVSSIMVLPCAVDKKQLGEMFTGAFASLKEGGKLVGETLNPKFNRYGEAICNRRFTWKEGTPDTETKYINIDFVNDQGGTDMSITDTYFSQEDVEKAAKDAGFKNLEWVTMEIDPADIEKNGAKFWEEYKKDPFYICFRAQK